MKKIIIAIMCLCIHGVIFGQEDVRYDAHLNLPFNEKYGDVNPQTGSITIRSTDVSLPGRNGYHFNFSRVYALNQANVFNMDMQDGHNSLTSYTIERYNNIGTAWSTNLPYIMLDEANPDIPENLFYGGNVYALDSANLHKSGEDRSNIIGYDLNDLRVCEKATVYYGMFDHEDTARDLVFLQTQLNIDDLEADYNAYVLTLKNNEQYFFRPDGKLMMQQDFTGMNRIWYFYENHAGKSRLKLVVDTVGRLIRFSYENGNIAAISWDVTRGTKDAQTGERRMITETRSVCYTYINSEDAAPEYPETNAMAAGVGNYQTPYFLESVTDPMGNVTRYEYAEGPAPFSFDQTINYRTNVFLLLTSITTCYDASDGSFKNKRVIEYDIPAKGLYTKYFYHGYMKFYKISRSYYLNKAGDVMNESGFTYYDDGEQANDRSYSTVVKIGGVAYTYKYSLQSLPSKEHVLEKMILSSDDGFLEAKVCTYNDDRSKYLDEVYRQGTHAFTERYEYDDKGNLTYMEDRAGLITRTEYDGLYSIPIRITRSFYRDGEQTTYIREIDIDDKGRPVAETIYDERNRPITITTNTYDPVYGNLIAQTDAAGNTVHTVYDAMTHTFPVKNYQDVSIASWSNGNDVHANWLSEPDGTQTVRIRSWKVFNTDGSVWIEIDNEGYAVEHYYDDLGTKVEAIMPDENDYTAFALPIPVIDGIPQGPDFDDFTGDDVVFRSFLNSRTDNPGVRMTLDYKNAVTITYTDIDENGVTVTGNEGDGLGNTICEVEYVPAGASEALDQEASIVPGLVPGFTPYAVKRTVYDAWGRMVALTMPDRGDFLGPVSIHGVRVNRYERTWLIKYDDVGREKKVSYPKTASRGQYKTITYDDRNNTITTIDPEKRTTIEHYDWNGNVIKIEARGDARTPESKYETYSFAYDSLNRKTAFTDARGLVTRYHYNERDLLTRQVYEDALIAPGAAPADVMVYDDRGLVIRKTDRKGQIITFDYDEMGRNTRSTHYKSTLDFENSIVDEMILMAYDNRGNAVRIANGHLIEHYIYDHAARVVTLERRLKDGDLRHMIGKDIWNGDADAQVFAFNYIYNNAGMVTDITYPNGSVHSFDYDPDLARLQAINEGAAGATPTGFITSFNYNRTGTVDRMTYANGTEQSWQFDNRLRISQIQVKNNTGTLADLEYTLDGSGNVLSINDNEYTYDGFSRIVGARSLIPETVGQQDLKKLVMQHFGAFRDPLFDTHDTYVSDADLNNDNRINGEDYRIAVHESKAQEYDVEAFTYDKNGNRTKLIQNGDIYYYTYGERNRLETIEVTRSDSQKRELFADYKYDANGNTVERTYYTDQGTRTETFEYDTMNRVTKTTSVPAGGIPTEVCEYFYDNAGNRFIKKTNDMVTLYLRHGQIAVAMDIEIHAGAGDRGPVSGDVTDDRFSVVGKINRYVLSGDLIAGRVTTTFTYDLSTDLVTPEVEKYYYHLDHSNSTKCVTKGDGSLDVMYEYRAFGEELKRIGDGDAKYTYGGKELDGATNLYYFNARYYDAAIGRFINVDPIQDGTNWYVYCNNNPLSFGDPTGLKTWFTAGTFNDGSSKNYFEGDDTFDASMPRELTNQLEGEGAEIGYLDWSGDNTHAARTEMISVMADEIELYKQNNPDSPINLVGHSHGGNVNKLLANELGERGITVDNFVTLATPNRLSEYSLEFDNVENFIEIVHKDDWVATKWAIFDGDHPFTSGVVALFAGLSLWDPQSDKQYDISSVYEGEEDWAAYHQANRVWDNIKGAFK